jgi:hypothetical protein
MSDSEFKSLLIGLIYGTNTGSQALNILTSRKIEKA